MRKRLASFMVELDSLLHDAAEFREDGLFIGAVASPIEEAGATADEALILLRPFDNFDVSGGIVHGLASSMADGFVSYFC